MKFLGFPCGSAGKESACDVGDLSLVPGLGRSPGDGDGYPLQYSGQGKSQRAIDFEFLFSVFLAVLLGLWDLSS